MIAAFLLSLGFLLIVLGLHPFTIYPVSLALLARLRPAPFRRDRFDGTVAICVCAYNEAGVISAKVDNMLALRGTVPSLEILVYVDAASDATADILRSYGDAVRVVVSPKRHGKTHGMNLLVGSTNADIVVFSDANVMFAEDALPALLAPYADPSVGCVCGHLVYLSREGGATASTGSLYWRLEEFLKRRESDTGSVMGADGSIFSIRRALHRPPPADLIDDMYVSLVILTEGKRLVSAPDAYAYEEAVSRPGEEFRRKQRIACQAFNVHRALAPALLKLSALDRYKYLSHKLLRWLTIYLLAAGVCLVLLGLAFAQAWTLLMVALLGGALLGVLLVSPLSGPPAALRDVILAFVATGMGVARSLRGQRFQTWEPPVSARRPNPL